MATIVSENSEAASKAICCKICDYICYKKQHYNQHLLTKKHKTNEINCVENKIVEKIEEKILEPHINYLTGTNMNIEYRDLLNNQKETL